MTYCFGRFPGVPGSRGGPGSPRVSSQKVQRRFEEVGEGWRRLEKVGEGRASSRKLEKVKGLGATVGSTLGVSSALRRSHAASHEHPQLRFTTILLRLATYYYYYFYIFLLLIANNHKQSQKFTSTYTFVLFPGVPRGSLGPLGSVPRRFEKVRGSWRRFEKVAESWRR